MILSLVEKFALIGLNGVDARNNSVDKTMVRRSLAAGVVLELYLDRKLELVGNYLQLKSDIHLEKAYQRIILEEILKNKKVQKGTLSDWLKIAAGMKQKVKKELEKSIVDELIGQGLMKEAPSLVGCDYFYESSGVTLKEYSTAEEAYIREVNSIKAQVLEDTVVVDESLVMVWLLRECGHIGEVFSKEELNVLKRRMGTLYDSSNFKLVKELLPIEIHVTLEAGITSYLKCKTRFVKTELGTGINFTFPFIERAESVFIETESMFANKKERLKDLEKRLSDHGYEYEVIRQGEVSLYKINKVYYEAIPHAERVRMVTIHGVRLRRYLFKEFGE